MKRLIVEKMHAWGDSANRNEHMEDAMAVKRLTAAKYLDKIVSLGLLEKARSGRHNYYLNNKLVDLLVNHEEIGA